jgi:hypothetical protein
LGMSCLLKSSQLNKAVFKTTCTVSILGMHRTSPPRVRVLCYGCAFLARHLGTSVSSILLFFLARLAQKKSCSSKGVELYRYSSPVNQFIQNVCLFKAHLDGIRCVSSTIPYSFLPRPFVSKSVRQQEIFHLASDLSNVEYEIQRAVQTRHSECFVILSCRGPPYQIVFQNTLCSAKVFCLAKYSACENTAFENFVKVHNSPERPFFLNETPLPCPTRTVLKLRAYSRFSNYSKHIFRYP